MLKSRSHNIRKLINFVYARPATQRCDGRGSVCGAIERLRLGQPEIGKGRDVMIGGVLRKAAEDNTPNPARRSGEFAGNGSDGDARGQIRRKTIDASRDGWKRKRHQTMTRAEINRGAIARRQQFVLAMIAAVPHRPDSVDHMLRRKPIGARDLYLTGLAPAEFFTFRAQLGAGRAMDGAVNTTAAKQCAVRRVDDCIERKRRNVGHADFEPGGTDFSSKKRRVFVHPVNISRPLGPRLRS
jgi:hypothetical protein